ncbi:MAG TPA: folate-binding protein [Verrucomicrobiae bacterium]|nr:folate-binding protein [Verrucomicrobiae bacterium]
MSLTALQKNAEGLGKTGPQYRTGEYHGATTAARFSDPQQEWAAMGSGCGVYDLGFRAKLSLTGRDRVRWLNGMITNNIRDLAAGQGVYAFFLTPQGHILGDLYAYNRGESIVLDTDHSQLEKVLATFRRYIIMDQVEMTDWNEQVTTLGVAGPKARSVLRTAGIEIPEARPLQMVEAKCDCDCDCVKCTVVRGDDAACESYELWLAPNDVRKTWDALVAAGATPVGHEALELRRIVNGIPVYGIDIREKDLPQETEQMRALNFSKGCYIGQEIVERIRSRGAVHRKLAGFLAEGIGKIAVGIKIVAGEKEAGEITSVASLHLDAGTRTVALGYIRREAGAPGNEVLAGDVAATVVQLPVDPAILAQSGRILEHHRA